MAMLVYTEMYAKINSIYLIVCNVCLMLLVSVCHVYINISTVCVCVRACMRARARVCKLSIPTRL